MVRTSGGSEEFDEVMSMLQASCVVVFFFGRINGLDDILVWSMMPVRALVVWVDVCAVSCVNEG